VEYSWCYLRAWHNQKIFICPKDYFDGRIGADKIIIQMFINSRKPT